MRMSQSQEPEKVWLIKLDFCTTKEMILSEGSWCTSLTSFIQILPGSLDMTYSKAVLDSILCMIMYVIYIYICIYIDSDYMFIIVT